MENVLSLSLENQNHVTNPSIFSQIKRDSGKYAEESGEDVIEYLMRDYDASPEGWDNCFEFSYDEISFKAKEERRNIIEKYLDF
jgi:hypothetical protein